MRFTIPLTPITKKNSQVIIYNPKAKRSMIIPSEQYRRYEKNAKPYIPKVEEAINYPIEMTCVFYMPTRRKVDLTNLLEGVDDLLVKYGVIEDDNYNIIVSHDGSRVKYDKENPRTEITITEYMLEEKTCENCKYSSQCGEADMDNALENDYECFNEGRY